MEQILLRAFAALAVACYAFRLLIDPSGRRSERRQRCARACWTAGCLCLILHILAALEFEHGWSQAAAWEHTRRRTFELTGFDSGIGLVANYVMATMWLIDAIGWNRALDWPYCHRRWYWLVQIVFAFLVLNATVVFGPWYWRPAAAIIVAAIWFTRRVAHRQ
jgi:hypothetical protein